MTGGRRAAGEQHDPGGPRPWWRCGGQPAAAACLAIVVFLVVALTTNEYGLTIDEGIYLSGAQRAGEWLALLVTAPSEAASTQAVSEYWPAVLEHGPAAIQDMQPGAAKLAAGLCSLLLGSWLGPLGAARAGTACFAALGCVVAYLFAGRLWGRAVGLYAAGALITVPEVFAHTHLCALDVPVMATTFAAAWLGYEAVRRDSWGWAAACGALWGLALGCKISALFVPVYLLPWAFLVHRRAALKLLIAGAVLGPLTFIASWPWLWHETGARLADYLRFHLQHYPVQVTYLGRVCSYAPWHYPAVMTTFRTPPVTLLLALVGVRLAASRRRRRGEGPNAQHPAPSSTTAPAGDGTPALQDGPDWPRAALWLLLAGAAVNLVIPSLPGAPKYNGMRLFLPLFPFVAMLAAYGLHRSLAFVQERLGPTAQPGALLTPAKVRAFLIGLALLLPIRAVGGTHPYQMSYYNVLIGGERGAARAGMEATYWGETIAAGLFWVADRAPGATVWMEPAGMVAVERMYGLPLNIVGGERPPTDAECAVFWSKSTELTPASRALIASGAPAFSQDVGGVPVVYVFDRAAIERAASRTAP